MSFVVDALDAQISRLANLADNNAIPYHHIVMWLAVGQTYFETFVM
jgi:hypothetical protein